MSVGTALRRTSEPPSLRLGRLINRAWAGWEGESTSKSTARTWACERYIQDVSRNMKPPNRNIKHEEKDTIGDEHVGSHIASNMKHKLQVWPTARKKDRW